MGKVAAIGRDGRFMVNPSNHSESTTHYSKSYISEGAAVTDGLAFYLDADDWGSYPGTKTLLGDFTEYSGRGAHFRSMGADGVVLLGSNTNFVGYFEVDTTSTGNHTFMFDYWGDTSSTNNFNYNNDGIMDNSFDATLQAYQYRKTQVQTVNCTSTGNMKIYFQNNTSGGKVYIDNVRFFESGTAWNDLSGNGNDGTISGATTAIDSTAGLNFDFDGSNDNIDVGSLGTSGEFSESTISVWFQKGSQTSNYGNVFDCNYGATDANKGPRMEVDIGGSIVRVYMGADDGNYTSISFGSLSNDVWYNLVLTVSPNSTSQDLKAYTDGALITSSTSSSTYVWDGDIADLYLGVGFSSARHFTGKIAAFNIYNKTLSAAEVQQNFNSERNRFGK